MLQNRLLRRDNFSARLSFQILWKKPLLLLAFLCSSFWMARPIQAQDVILQGFYWNSHPGDLTNVNAGGIWWDTLATVAPEIGQAGFATVWTPPPIEAFLI